MTGGGHNDIFRFGATSHSVVGVRADVIIDFDDFGDDRIDVSALFGAPMAYRHNLGFTAAGQVRTRYCTSAKTDLHHSYLPRKI